MVSMRRQVVGKALLSYGLVRTRADLCTCILFGDHAEDINSHDQEESSERS